MLHKPPKPFFWKFVKGSAKTLFIAEAICFAASYGVYYRLNTNREFRLYTQENFPYVLDYFYKVGEFFGDSDLRKKDLKIWQKENQIGKKDE